MKKKGFSVIRDCKSNLFDCVGTRTKKNKTLLSIIRAPGTWDCLWARCSNKAVLFFLHLILILHSRLPFPQSDPVCTLARLSRSPPPWRCSAATAQWCPTATAPVTTRSQTTSSSACLVFGRTPGPARPFSSKP